MPPAPTPTRDLASTPIGVLASRPLITVSRTAPVSVALEALARNGISALVVVDGRDPVGLLSRSDLVDLAPGEDPPVHSRMTPLVVSLPADTALADAARVLTDLGIHRILVDGEPPGLLSTTDVTRALAGLAGELPVRPRVLGHDRQAPHPRDLFVASLDRLDRVPGFIDVFYDRLVHGPKAVARHFEGLDRRRQKIKLQRSFRLAADAVIGKPEALRALAAQATVHDRDHRNVPPSLYPVWIELLVATVRELDPGCDLQTEMAWRLVMSHVARSMRRRY